MSDDCMANHKAPRYLPIHIQEILYSCDFERKKAFSVMGYSDNTMLSFHLSQNVKTLPWERDNKVVKKTSGTTSKTVFHRVKKSERADFADGDPNKYKEFDELISTSPYKKLQFDNLINPFRDGLPAWALTRLETSSRDLRFELPFNKKLLEGMTPLYYLAHYCRLNNEQQRRYQEVFKKFKNKYNEIVEFKSLHPALNSLFGGLLSAENFNVIRIGLFIDEEYAMDVKTFVGVCALADRMFWTRYLDHEGDTFLTWAPNRSPLECVDFENLNRKLEGINLSKEMSTLLHSLA